MSKKLFKCLLIAAIFIPLVSGCNRVNMDELAEDNLYHYKNHDFKFSIDLPEEFIYYQTQRISTENYTDIEYYVPTSDTDYPTRVPSYGKALTIRVFNTNDWQNILAGKEDGDAYEWLSEAKDRVYTVKFWENIPSDWQDRWSEDMKQGIKNSFKLN